MNYMYLYLIIGLAVSLVIVLFAIRRHSKSERIEKTTKVENVVSDKTNLDAFFTKMSGLEGLFDSLSRAIPTVSKLSEKIDNLNEKISKVKTKALVQENNGRDYKPVFDGIARALGKIDDDISSFSKRLNNIEERLEKEEHDNLILQLARMRSSNPAYKDEKLFVAKLIEKRGYTDEEAKQIVKEIIGSLRL